MLPFRGSCPWPGFLRQGTEPKGFQFFLCRPYGFIDAGRNIPCIFAHFPDGTFQDTPQLLVFFVRGHSFLYHSFFSSFCQPAVPNQSIWKSSFSIAQTLSRYLSMDLSPSSISFLHFIHMDSAIGKLAITTANTARTRPGPRRIWPQTA